MAEEIQNIAQDDLHTEGTDMPFSAFTLADDVLSAEEDEAKKKEKEEASRKAFQKLMEEQEKADKEALEKDRKAQKESQTNEAEQEQNEPEQNKEEKPEETPSSPPYLDVIRALCQLYEIPHVTPDFEKRAEDHNFRLAGVDWNEDNTKPEVIVIRLSEEAVTAVTKTTVMSDVGLSAKTAYEMAMIAAMNPAMREKGVAIKTNNKDDARLLYQAAKTFGLRIQDEDKLGADITAEPPQSWKEFVADESRQQPKKDTVEPQEASEASGEEPPDLEGTVEEHEQDAPVVSGKQDKTEVIEDADFEDVVEPSKTETETETEYTNPYQQDTTLLPSTGGENTKVKALPAPQEEKNTTQKTEGAVQEKAEETPDVIHLPHQADGAEEAPAQDNEALFTLEQVKKNIDNAPVPPFVLKDLFNSKVDADLYKNAKKFVVETQKVSRKRLRDEFGIGATRAQAILRGLEEEGYVAKTGANARVVTMGRDGIPLLVNRVDEPLKNQP